MVSYSFVLFGFDWGFGRVQGAYGVCVLADLEFQFKVWVPEIIAS